VKTRHRVGGVMDRAMETLSRTSEVASLLFLCRSRELCMLFRRRGGSNECFQDVQHRVRSSVRSAISVPLSRNDVRTLSRHHARKLESICLISSLWLSSFSYSVMRVSMTGRNSHADVVLIRACTTKCP
jgi:hypothetical protein